MHRWASLRSIRLAAFLAVLPALACHAEPTARVPAGAFASQLVTAGRLVAACHANASACSPEAVPADVDVQDGGTAFHVSWQWLREAIGAAKQASPVDREKLLRSTQQHLAEMQAELGQPESTAPAQFLRVRAAANAALAGNEFQAEEGPTWLQRQWARVQDGLLRFFTGVDRLGRQAPWLAPLVEWGCFLLAAGGLLWFVRQSLARQALRITLGEGAARAHRNGGASADWARLAEECAAAHDWREAVHCLYWAAIALLEGRRAWRPNAARTPREYLALLRAGSATQAALRDLTRAFEQVWYGQQAGEEAQFQAALASYEALEAAAAERPEAGPAQPAARFAAGAS